MDMKEEIMNDAIDDAMEDEADEEERYMMKLFTFFSKKNVETCLLNISNTYSIYTAMPLSRKFWMNWVSN